MGWMGPGEHEGWVVPLFADGAEGAGTSGAQGVLVMVDGVEEWRPDAAVIGWRAGCECGWRGPVWTRVASKTLLPPQPQARLLATSGPFYDLDDPDETRVMAEWRQHIAPAYAVEAVQEAAEQLAAAGALLDDAVRAARAAGASWADVGRAAGMTRQSANERWAALAARSSI